MLKKILIFILAITAYTSLQANQYPNAYYPQHPPRAMQAKNLPHARQSNAKYPMDLSQNFQAYRGYIPKNAYAIGHDTNGKVLFACRAHYKGSLQPGKTWHGYDNCNIGYGGKEYAIKHFEIMTQKPGLKTHWEPKGASQALTVGKDTDGKALYFCKTRFANSIQPGKTWSGYNHCNISYAGKEILQSQYRVLVVNKQHRAHRRHPKNLGYRCIEHFGNSVCGYNCIKTLNHTACASSPAEHCLADNFGNIQCGFNCVKSPFKVACAPDRSQNCVVNTFNEIRCGRNCRIDQFNRIHCG